MIPKLYVEASVRRALTITALVLVLAFAFSACIAHARASRTCRCGELFS